MEKTAIALFRKHQHLEEAFRELEELHFLRSQLKSFTQIGSPLDACILATIDTHENDRLSDMNSGLYRSLRGWGVPPDEALLFTEGVRQGGILAVVIVTEQTRDSASKILKRHGALDLNARKIFAEQDKQKPTMPLTESPFTQISSRSKYADEFAQWLAEHRSEVGPRSAVKIYEIPRPNEDLGLERNLNE